MTKKLLHYARYLLIIAAGAAWVKGMVILKIGTPQAVILPIMCGVVFLVLALGIRTLFTMIEEVETIPNPKHWRIS